MTAFGLRRGRLRNDELRALIAVYLVEAPLASRIPTVRDLDAQFGASIGAVQQSLARLEAAGAGAVDSRPGQGAGAASRSLGGLWSAAGHQPPRVAPPPPA